MTLGEALRQSRIRAGLTIREATTLASTQGAKISASFLSDLENGRYDQISVDRLLALVRAYGDTAEAILRSANMLDGSENYIDLRDLDPGARRIIRTLTAIAGNENAHSLLERVSRIEARQRLFARLLEALIRQVGDGTVDAETLGVLRDAVTPLDTPGEPPE